jgi:hypothetical protein
VIALFPKSGSGAAPGITMRDGDFIEASWVDYKGRVW